MCCRADHWHCSLTSCEFLEFNHHPLNKETFVMSSESCCREMNLEGNLMLGLFSKIIVGSPQRTISSPIMGYVLPLAIHVSCCSSCVSQLGKTTTEDCIAFCGNKSNHQGGSVLVSTNLISPWPVTKVYIWPSAKRSDHQVLLDN